MFESDQYQLVDFGHGRKLERFGSHLLDRPAPVAVGVAKARPAEWREAGGTFLESGSWRWKSADPAPWEVQYDKLRLELKATVSGQIGLFPEQSLNWPWLTEQIERLDHPPEVLNLFAYTGSTSLLAAAHGARVVHVDAAKSAVEWAKRNAQRSGLSDAPVRWIVDDATKFLNRELRRGRQYDAVILDPPTYGHGPKREPWKIEEHLPNLLSLCGQLTRKRGQFMLLTAHTPSLRPNDLRTLLRENVQQAKQIDHRELSLESHSGRNLYCGDAMLTLLAPIK